MKPLALLLIASIVLTQTVPAQQQLAKGTSANSDFGPLNANNMTLGKIFASRMNVVVGSVCFADGNSIVNSDGSTTPANSSFGLRSSAFRGIVGTTMCTGTYVNSALNGSYAADHIDYGLLNRQTAQVSLTPFSVPDYGAGITFIGGPDNEDNATAVALNTNQQVYYQQLHKSLILMRAIPTSQWINASSPLVTTTGTCAANDYYGSIPPAQLCTSAGATISFSFTPNVNPNGTTTPLYLFFPMFASDTGTFTVTDSVTGQPMVDVTTGSSTISNAPFNGATFQTNSSFTQTIAVAKFVGLASGAHTITITSTAAGTNGIGMHFAATVPGPSQVWTLPAVAVQGAIPQNANNAGAATLAYNNLALADANELKADGLNIIPVDVRQYLTVANVGQTMSGTVGHTSNAIAKTDLSLNGTTTITSASGFSGYYVGQKVQIVNGLTSSTDLYATVLSFTATTLVLDTAAGVTATGLSGYFGPLGVVYPASGHVGQHPNDWGYALIARAYLDALQPVTSVPSANVAALQNFLGGFQSNFSSTFTSLHFNAANQAVGLTLTSTPLCWDLFSANGTSTTRMGSCYVYDVVKAQPALALITQVNRQLEVCEQAAFLDQNGSLRCNLVVDPGTNGTKGMLFNGGLESFTLGATLTAGATLAPTSYITPISTAGNISTITVPSGTASLGLRSASPALVGFIGCLKFLSLGGFTTSTAGNILNAITTVPASATASGIYDACYNGTSWYISGSDGGGGTPTIANGAAAGTSPGTATITGTNQSGNVTIITGTAPAPNAVLATITWGQTLATAFRGCSVTGTNAAAVAASTTVFPGTPSTTTVTLNTGGAALAVSTTYTFYYSCK